MHGEGKGALLYSEKELRDTSGTLLAATGSATFLRRDDGFGGAPGPVLPPTREEWPASPVPTGARRAAPRTGAPRSARKGLTLAEARVARIERGLHRVEGLLPKGPSPRPRSTPRHHWALARHFHLGRHKLFPPRSQAGPSRNPSSTRVGLALVPFCEAMYRGSQGFKVTHTAALRNEDLMTRPWQDEILMIIPSINGGVMLRRMLPTLRFKSSNILVLDQGSTDDTAEVCAAAGVKVVQLGVPHTYTRASNIGADLARARGAKYVCIANNDITFQTDVLAEMYAELEHDPELGIVAPSQFIIDSTLDRTYQSQRVLWNLEDVAFLHDLQDAGRDVRRQEADFCELTCALIRLSAVDKVGFLDDEFGFYHEDADFGFRLRLAGYNCAYLPQSQINHYSSSTINREKLSLKAEYLIRNKQYFARKHLGYGVRHLFNPAWSRYEQGLLNRQFHSVILRYGLVDETAPELQMFHPGDNPSDYLYTTSEMTGKPSRWEEYSRRCGAIFTASAHVRDILVRRGVGKVYHVPLGFDPDIFHPWGPRCRLHGATTYLAVLDGWQSRSLSAVLAAWHRFAVAGREVRLVLLGRGLIEGLQRIPDTIRRSGPMHIARYDAERIDVYETSDPVLPEDLVSFYRGADFTIFGSCGEGLVMPVLESMACGVPCIFGDYGSTSDFSFEGALTFGRAGLPPGTSSHSSPSIEGMVARLEESFRMDLADRAALAKNGLRKVRGQATVRHMAMGLYAALGELQTRDPSRFLDRLRQNQDVNGPAINLWSASGYGRIRQRLSSQTAKHISTAGNLTSQFGAVWQRQGLKAASHVTARKLRHTMSWRSKAISELSGRTVRRLQSRLEQVVEPIWKSAAPVPNSALLIGYIDALLGLGQSLRGLALALSQTSISFQIYPFGVGVEGRRSGSYMPERYETKRAHAVNVIEVMPDELPTVFGHVRGAHFSRSYNVLRTYWELSKAPEAWRTHLRQIDEIWVPNEFVAKSFQTVFDGPISVVPPCVELRSVELDGRARFRLEETSFYFLFSFDYYSFPQRKNPLAVVRAFRSAFPDPDTRVGLIIKSTGAPEHHLSIRESLRVAAQYDGRIEIVDEEITRDEMLALLTASDCYVSLHRSEGFGFGMVEAMALGKPVIGTDYSGSTDFLTPETGYPVPYRLKQVGSDEYVHTEGQVWAEPSEAACAEIMRHVFTAREEAAARARTAQSFVCERYGPVGVGRTAEKRLNEIYAIIAERAVGPYGANPVEDA